MLSFLVRNLIHITTVNNIHLIIHIYRICRKYWSLTFNWVIFFGYNPINSCLFNRSLKRVNTQMLNVIIHTVSKKKARLNILYAYQSRERISQLTETTDASVGINLL